MSRLTSEPFRRKSDDSLENYKVRRYGREEWETLAQNAINKLGRLEDIEEELGCPLEVVFKGMSDYVVEYKINDEIVVGLISNIFKAVSGKWIGSFIPKRYILGKREYYTENIELNQYQKTWWLKGEKENE